MTRREEIITLLQQGEATSEQLAYHFQTTRKNILTDLDHIRKTLKRKKGELLIKMPVCRSCGFQFKLDTVKEPSKCPKCNSTWIEPPTYKVMV